MDNTESKSSIPEERSLADRVRKLEIKVQVLEILMEKLSTGTQELLSELVLKME